LSAGPDVAALVLKVRQSAAGWVVNTRSGHASGSNRRKLSDGERLGVRPIENIGGAFSKSASSAISGWTA
jgi:hypothetical protein